MKSKLGNHWEKILFLLFGAGLGCFYFYFDVFSSETVLLKTNRFYTDFQYFVDNFFTIRSFGQRPLSNFLTSLIHFLFDGKLNYFFFFSSLFHVVSSYFLYLSLKEINIKLPLVFAIVFLLHPQSIYAIGSVFGFSYCLGTMFMSMGFYRLIKFPFSKREIFGPISHPSNSLSLSCLILNTLYLILSQLATGFKLKLLSIPFGLPRCPQITIFALCLWEPLNLQFHPSTYF